MQVLLLHDGGYVWGLLGVEVCSMSGGEPDRNQKPTEQNFSCRVGPNPVPTYRTTKIRCRDSACARNHWVSDINCIHASKHRTKIEPREVHTLDFFNFSSLLFERRRKVGSRGRAIGDVLQ